MRIHLALCGALCGFVLLLKKQQKPAALQNADGSPIA